MHPGYSIRGCPDTPIMQHWTSLNIMYIIHGAQVYLIIIAGLLSAVTSPSIIQQDSTLFLNWTAPFSQDISGVEPDITGYYVNVFINDVFDSTEFVDVTEFTYHIPPDSRGSGCVIQFTVTPVNLVGNGTSATFQYNGTETSTLLCNAKKPTIMCFTIIIGPEVMAK